MTEDEIRRRAWVERFPWIWAAISIVLVIAVGALAVALIYALQAGDTAREAKAAAQTAQDTANREKADEFCITQWIDASAARTRALAAISTRRTAASNARTNAISVEQRLFSQSANPKLTNAQHRRLVVLFVRALHAYARADARYKRLDALYNAADKAHPVPTLNLRCADKRFKVGKKPAAASVPKTRTVTAHATATRTVHPPPVVRTVVVPRIRVVTRVVTRTVAPGHRHH